jgi:hypothetical protein
LENIIEILKIMKKYYIMTIEKNNSDGMYNLSFYFCYNKLKLFNLLFNLENKSKMVLNKMDTLTEHKK